MHDPIYLDYNATTPLLPEVVDAMLPYLREHFGNPSSGHIYGARAAAAVAHARAKVATLLGCDAEEIVFTSGGTEANNLAIHGVIAATAPPGAKAWLAPGAPNPTGRGWHIVTSTIEHPATARPCTLLAQQGHRVTRLPVDGDGRIAVRTAQAAMGAATRLVTVMHSNNETGVLQPIAELAQVAHANGALMHTDAAQSVGKVAVNVRALDVDLLSLAGHKLYAPKGVGALYIKRGTPIAPVLLGAGHERGVRPGTENVAAIVGLGAACELLARNVTIATVQMQQLRDLLWQRLVASVPGLVRNGHETLRLPNTLNVRFPGVAGSAVLAGAPEVAASTGSACHDSQEHASAVIVAMGVAPAAALGSVRLTLGQRTTMSQVELAAAALVRAWRDIS